MIRAVVVDDESLARAEMSRLIRENTDFQVIGEASNGEEALQIIKLKKPDLVFLDIDMPKLNGLEVAGHLCDWEDPPLVVFATAFHQHALEAFDMHAIDYVLKPYDPERLKKCFEKVKERLESKSPNRERLTSLEDYLIKQGTIKKLVGHRRNAKDRIVIQPEEVFYFFAKLAEVTVHLENQEFIVNSTIKEIAANLNPEQFAQTHRAYIVNLNKIEKVSPLFSGNFQITLKGPKAEKIPLSRRYAKRIKQLLGNW